MRSSPPVHRRQGYPGDPLQPPNSTTPIALLQHPPNMTTLLLPTSITTAGSITSINIDPFQYLLPELLGNIFMLCIREVEDYWDISRSRRSVLVLSHINKHWRDVALSTPMLWSSISVNLEKPESEFPLCQAWLSRAGRRPLSIAIYHGHYTKSWLSIDILNLLMSHCERWQHLLLELPWLSFHYLTPIKDNLPILESLRMLPEKQIPPSTVDIFRSAPKLHRIWIEPFVVRQVRVPWHQLTHFEIVECSSWELLDILTICDSLEALAVHGIKDNPVLFQPPPPHPLVWHTNLRTLKLTILYDRSFLLDHLFLPTLRDFTFFQSQLWTKEPLISLLSRSSCSLRRLFIYISASADDIMHILQHTPELTELGLYQRQIRSIAKETLELLRISPNAPKKALVPRLRCLRVYGEAHMLALARVVQSRWRLPQGSAAWPEDYTVSRLRRVMLWDVKDLAPVARASMREFAAEGLDVMYVGVGCNFQHSIWGESMLDSEE